MLFRFAKLGITCSGKFRDYAPGKARGEVALDGDGSNSTYTTALLKVLAEPGLPVESVFKRVRSEVANATGDAQVPWESSSLTGDFYFASAGTSAKPVVPEASAAAANRGSDAEAELLYWQSVKDSRDAEDYEACLKQYPNGRFTDIARNRLNRMKASPAIRR